ncbi:MAG: formylglycine-generating enzyme family protein [Verrucomicrobia bacterium]|nr:formylglycine-generating enzyme family protein [Verrucomicrobiota bacterium]
MSATTSHRIIGFLLLISFFSHFSGQAEELKDDINLTKKIRALILKKSTVSEEGKMKDYHAVISKTEAPYDMVAIKGGEFFMGSPDDEKHRENDEGPQHKVHVEPFWMGKYEVTWDQIINYVLNKNTAYRTRNGALFSQSSINMPDDPITAISAPSEYAAHSLSSNSNQKGFPVVGISQHTASKYCQWLSAKTGHYYRLPTEAEWEYACRAGTPTTYSSGNDANNLKKYAVFDVNQPAKVGSKIPNPWKLYDMHGNVMEWCLNQYYPDAYRSDASSIPATKLYPRVFRGGSWYDYPENLRSSARFYSEKNFKQDDPLSPKSYWHLSNAPWLGFRIVRPLTIPSAEEMFQLWNSGKIKDM